MSDNRFAFDLAAEICAKIADDVWNAKVEILRHHMSSRRLGKIVLDGEDGIAAIKSGDWSRMDRWLERRRDRRREELGLAAEPA